MTEEVTAPEPVPQKITAIDVTPIPEPGSVHTETIKLYCDVCDGCLWDLGTNVIAMNFRFINRSDEEHIEFKRVEKAFGKKEFNVCGVCYLRSIGIKEK